MAGEHVWAKVYLELPTDPKLVGRSAHDRYLWVCLILLAKGSDEPGRIPPWQANPAYLSKYTAIGQAEIRRAIGYFLNVGLVEAETDDWLALPKFVKRQSSTDPKAAERMRTLRERSANTDATLRHTRDRENADRTSSPGGDSVLTEADRRKQSADADGAATADAAGQHTLIREIFEDYQRLVMPTARLLDAARDKIRTRLKTWSKDELLKAMENFSRDWWEMQNNATRGAAWFFESDKRIEGFVNLVPRTEPPASSNGHSHKNDPTAAFDVIAAWGREHEERA